jgi:hypothetical protein
MFGDLYDSISLLFSQRWPKAEATITAVNRGINGELMVIYEFSVDGDGPYTGESASSDDTVFINTLIGQRVMVRYRKGDPSVNKLD